MNPNPPPALELRQVHFHWGAQHWHFNGTLAAGERRLLAGPSGVGKSTLLALLAGFLNPSAGEIWLAGQRVNGWPPARRPLALLFQEDNLFSHLSARQNLLLGLRPSLKASAEEESAIAAVAARLGLTGLLDRRPDALSGGQRQRVALGRCLLQRRPLLLLDEPFSALDPALRLEMQALLLELCQENHWALLLVSHQPEECAPLVQSRWTLAPNAAGVIELRLD